ncbi:MAG: Holliday junction branch migration protein RuvA [Thiohalocapsa sp.]
MIAKLSGIVDSVGTDGAVVDVGGVGYLVFASSRTLGRLPPSGADIRLLIETHVREDHIHLYGFVDPAERDWFRLLVTVQGVGARLALAILSAAAPEALLLAILAQDKAVLTQADGVGPRLAARIVNELRDKVGGLALPQQAPVAAAAGVAGGIGGDGAGAVSPEAVSALVNLGYRRAEAFGAVAAASRRLGNEAALDALIRAGLQELGRSQGPDREAAQ